MVERASIEAIERGLRSKDANARTAALEHAAAHGRDAAPIAPTIAACLEDPEELVRYTAVGAMRAMGKASVEATPDLIRMAQRPDGEVPHLRTRATFLLGMIGVDAQLAVSPLLSLAREEGRRGALEALARIADERSPAAVDAVLEALFDPDYSTRSAVARALSGAGGHLAERALEQAARHLGSAEHGRSAIAVLDNLRTRFPARTKTLAHRVLLEARVGAGAAARFVERGEGPVPVEVAQAMIALAEGGDWEVYARLARCGARLPRAALRPALDGLQAQVSFDAELRALAALAGLIAELAPGSGRGVGVLLARCEHELRAETPALYPLGHLLVSIAKLADDETRPRASALLGAAVTRSRGALRKNESAALDLQRQIAEALAILSPDQDGPTLEVTSIDREFETRPAAPRGLPPIRAIAKGARGKVRSPKKSELAELKAARAKGRALLKAAGLRKNSKAAAVARFVDQEVRAQRRRGALDAEAVPALAALYGDALVRELGWSWRLFEQGESRALAVVAPFNTHVVVPGWRIGACMTPGTEVTLLLGFNMLQARGAPPARRGSLTPVG